MLRSTTSFWIRLCVACRNLLSLLENLSPASSRQKYRLRVSRKGRRVFRSKREDLWGERETSRIKKGLLMSSQSTGTDKSTER